MSGPPERDVYTGNTGAWQHSLRGAARSVAMMTILWTCQPYLHPHHQGGGWEHPGQSQDCEDPVHTSAGETGTWPAAEEVRTHCRLQSLVKFVHSFWTLWLSLDILEYISTLFISTSYPFIQIQSLKFVILIERKYCAQTKMRGMENEFLTLFQVQEQVSDAEVSLRLWHQRHLLLLQNGLIRQNIYKIFSDLTQCWNTNSLAELGD